MTMPGVSSPLSMSQALENLMNNTRQFIMHNVTTYGCSGIVIILHSLFNYQANSQPKVVI